MAVPAGLFFGAACLLTYISILTFILFRDASHGHTVDSFLLQNPHVSSIIDLSCEVDNYEISERFPLVRHLKLSFESKVIPSTNNVQDFIHLVQENLPPDKENVSCRYYAFQYR